MKVLVVDDSASVRLRLAAMIGDLPGVDGVLQASGTAEAREILRDRRPEVVVLDLHLRDESGLAFVPYVELERPGAVLIVVTNLPTQYHRRQCLSLGAAHFFDKSRELDQLLGVVARAALDAPPIRDVAKSDTTQSG